MLEFSERAGFVPKEKLMVWSFREAWARTQFVFRSP